MHQVFSLVVVLVGLRPTCTAQATRHRFAQTKETSQRKHFRPLPLKKHRSEKQPTCVFLYS